MNISNVDTIDAWEKIPTENCEKSYPDKEEPF